MAFIWFNPWADSEGSQPHRPRHGRGHGHARRHSREEGRDAAQETAKDPKAQAQGTAATTAAAAPEPAEQVGTPIPAEPRAEPRAEHADAQAPASPGLAPVGDIQAEVVQPQAPAEGARSRAFVAMPSTETLQKYQQMEDDNHKAEDGYLQKFENFIKQKKDQVFSLFHYIFGAETKEPEKGENGHPRLENGGETPEQRAARLAWEEAQRKPLQERQDQEMQSLIRKAQQEASQFNNPYDPTQNRRMYESMTRLQGEEGALRRGQAEEMSRVGIAGLPDPNVPGRTLSQFVDDGWGTYDRMVKTNRDGEANSPEGKQINEYIQYVLDTPFAGWGGGALLA